MGEKWFQSKNFLDSVFFQSWKTPRNYWTLFFFLKPFLPHVWDSVFFQTTKNEKVLSLPLSKFFQTRVLETFLGRLKAACIGPALSKFRPSVMDGATEPRVRTGDIVKTTAGTRFFFKSRTAAATTTPFCHQPPFSGPNRTALVLNTKNGPKQYNKLFFGPKSKKALAKTLLRS
jgi:hypothetical protein